MIRSLSLPPARPPSRPRPTLFPILFSHFSLAQQWRAPPPFAPGQSSAFSRPLPADSPLSPQVRRARLRPDTETDTEKCIAPIQKRDKQAHTCMRERTEIEKGDWRQKRATRERERARDGGGAGRPRGAGLRRMAARIPAAWCSPAGAVCCRCNSA